mgnify:FL=1
MPYILASASPRRQELLHKITDDFIVQPADVDETIPDDILPEDAAVYLSHIKAEAVSNQYPGSIVIGCDTIVLLNDQILGKPHSPEQAREMLQMLSGNRHQVITGTPVTDGSHTISFASETAVQFYPLSEAEISAYLETGEPFDKAGAYGIQGKGSLLIQGIQGDYFAVMGLPVAKLYRVLQQFETDFKKEASNLHE